MTGSGSWPSTAGGRAAAALRSMRRGRLPEGGGASCSLLAGDRFHLVLGVLDDRVQIVGGVVGPLELLQPRAGRVVDLLEEGQRVRRPADGQGLGHVRDERLSLVVLVVLELRVGPGRQV